MPGKQRPGPGVGAGVLRDPRNMVKAELPEPKFPEDWRLSPPERYLKPAPCSAAV